MRYRTIGSRLALSAFAATQLQACNMEAKTIEKPCKEVSAAVDGYKYVMFDCAKDGNKKDGFVDLVLSYGDSRLPGAPNDQPVKIFYSSSTDPKAVEDMNRGYNPPRGTVKLDESLRTTFQTLFRAATILGENKDALLKNERK